MRGVYRVLGGVLALVLVVRVLGLVVVPASANHLPADKIGVSASVMEVMQTQVGPGSGSSTVSLLGATLRNSTPTDLIIEFTGECALWTDIISPESEAAAKVTVWVELDGVAVPVTGDSNPDGTLDDGKVVFSNRAFRISAPVSVGLIELFQNTRSANAFNWVTLNVGSGIHTLEVKASLQASGTVGTFAQAAVGKRTLVVEPAKLANDVSI